MEILSGMETERADLKGTVVRIDRAFPVKGVGEIVLGFVTKGELHRHDKLTLLPSNKDVTIRSV